MKKGTPGGWNLFLPPDAPCFFFTVSGLSRTGGMKYGQETVDTLNDKRAIKLFIELTQCPCQGDFLWIDRSSDLEDEFIEKLFHRSQSEIINFLIDFKKEQERYDDEYYI